MTQLIFYAGNQEYHLICHIEELYATCLRLDIDLKHMEVNVGGSAVAREIFREVQVIRKVLSDWQKPKLMMQLSRKLLKSEQNLDSNEDGIRKEELIHDEIEKISSVDEPMDNAGCRR